MSEKPTEQQPDPSILAELSALADGTIEPDRGERLRELIAQSPELRARYQRERRAVLALQSLGADRAPATLRSALETQRRRLPRRRRRPVFGLALTASAALAAILLALLLPGGSPGAPSVSQAAALALRGPTLPAPAHDEAYKLSANVGELYFPDWSALFGWRPVGRRIDRLDGKRAVTVYYARDGRQIAYTILTAPPLRWPGSHMLHLDGIRLERFTARGRLIVTWRANGHTCLLSGTDVMTGELASLAGWKPPARG